MTLDFQLGDEVCWGVQMRKIRKRTFSLMPQAKVVPEANTYLVHPILAVVVLHALVQCPC